MKRIFLLIIFVSLQAITFSQEIPNLSKRSINDKFELIIEKSNNYKDYKVIKKELLYNLKKQVLDSVINQKQKISKLNNIISKQHNNITSLQEKLATSNAEIIEINTNKENINFMGMDFKKDSFKIVFFILTPTLVYCY